MKKYLLFALSALMGLTVSAQPGKKLSENVQRQQQQTIQHQVVSRTDIKVSESSNYGQKQVVNRQQPTNPNMLRALKRLNVAPQGSLASQAHRINISKKELKSAKSLMNGLKGAPRKAAGELKEAYNGKGKDYNYDGTTETITPVTWEMANGSVTWNDGTESSVFFNVVPTPEEFLTIEGFEDGVFYEYTIDNGVAVIEPQPVVQYTNRNGDPMYVYLFAADNRGAILNDGAIRLTIDEDGAVEPNTNIIILGVFSAEEFDSSNYLGYYQLTMDVEYAYEGQQPKVPEGVQIKEVYDGTGINYRTKQAETWKMIMGSRESREGKEDVLVNMVPTPSQLAADNPKGIAIPYTQTGNTITVQPTRMGVYNRYFLYLCSGTSQDGSISFTVNADGTLDTGDKMAIVVGAFTEDKFDPSFGDTYAGYVTYYQKVQYLRDGQIVIPSPEYEPDGLYLIGEITAQLTGYNATLAFLPAYATQTLRNFTDANSADAYSWRMAEIDNSGAEISETTSEERDFTFTTGGENAYKPAELTAYNQGEASEPYIWMNTHDPHDAYINSSLFSGSSSLNPNGDQLILSKASINENSITLGRHFGTPDVNSNGDQITKLVFYQGKPAKPLYFEGINLLVWELKDFDNIDLKCQIVQAKRNERGWVDLGEVIAESVISVDDIVQGYNSETPYYWNLWQLCWNNFYVYDEQGWTEDVEYLQIDEEFAIVIEGWENGTFSCMPLMEADQNNNGEVSTFFYLTGDDEYTEDDMLAYTSDYAHVFVGFTNPIYGYLHTEDSTNFEVGKNGGSAQMHINPMLYTGNDESPTAIWVEEVKVNGEIIDPEDLDWITPNIANEVYTSEDQSFDLILDIAALPEGITKRNAEIKFAQWGATLLVTISQDDSGSSEQDGIANVSVRRIDNAKTFNVAGQRVMNGKGLIVRDGKKTIVKQ